MRHAGRWWFHRVFSFCRTNLSCFSILPGASFDRPGLQKTCRNPQHAPGSAISEDAAHLALKCLGTEPELCAELTGKRSQASIADLEANIRHAALEGKHLPCAVHA